SLRAAVDGAHGRRWHRACVVRALQHARRSRRAGRGNSSGAKGVWLMDASLRELYQEIILDHSRHPRHFGPLAGANRSAEGHNPLCGDRVKIQLRLGENGRIDEVMFEGRGCAISVASASLMTDLLKGRTVQEAEKLMGGFLDLVKGEKTSTLAPEDREQ